jgi:putative ABC transport system permease protein
MLRHALKLIWNRRRASRLVVIEIAAAFVITFMLTGTAINLVGNYRRPLGFDYENFLSVIVQRSDSVYSRAQVGMESYSDTIEAVLDALRALPRTEVVEPMMTTPYEDGYRMTLNILLNPRLNRTTTEALQAIGVELVAGRWFGPEDEGQPYRAALVNQAYSEEAFGSDTGAIGQRIDRPDPNPVVFLGAGPPQPLREVRIVGVIEDFRTGGEFSATMPLMIERHEPGDESGFGEFSLMLKPAPGTDANFAEQVVETVESIAPDWVTSVTSWEQRRTSSHRNTLLPVKAVATIAAFFIALVVMGLVGVLWQDVVRRTQEIGLRRALGAGAASVRRQIQLETLVIGAFGILIGSVIAIQFPLLQGDHLATAVPALALSAVVILVLVLLGALYPSWLASRREPADALRYE